MRSLSFSGFVLMGAAIFGLSACQPKQTALMCEVRLESPEGGLIDAARIDNTPMLKVNSRELSWMPPRSEGKIDLKIGYWGDTLETLPAPGGSAIRFDLPEQIPAGRLEVIISGDGGEIRRFSGGSILVSTYQGGLWSGIVQMDEQVADSEKTAAAMQAAKRLTVEVMLDGKLKERSVFDTSATKGRDALVAKAREIFALSDPAHCQPLPRG